MALNIAWAFKVTVYFVLMPHPEKWTLGSSPDGQVELWKLTEIWNPVI